MANRIPLAFNPTYGFQETFAASDNLDAQGGKVVSLGAATTSGDAISYAQSGASLAGLALTAALLMGGNQINNLGAPTSGTDAATKTYVDNLFAGIRDIKESARAGTTANLSVTASGTGVGKTLTATANGAISIDGVSLALNERVLVKNQSTGADNGIYFVSTVGDGSNPYVLTRTTDADQNTEVSAGMFLFVTEGSVNADTGWVMTTDDPITVDTTSLAFAQFSSTASLTYDQGLLKSGTSITVELDTGANAQGAGAGGGSSGLEFDANTASGKLRAAVNATGGLQRSASGLAVLLNGTTLLSGASGLSVKGLPSLFEINTVAVSANVTAANLGTLTAGATSDAGALHSHPAAPRFSAVSVGALAAGDPVYWSSTNNQVDKARADTDTKSFVVGLNDSGAVSGGGSANVIGAGKNPGVLSGATAGTPYYLASTGGITTTAPGSGNRIIQVGVAYNATDLWVRVVDYGKKV